MAPVYGVNFARIGQACAGAIGGFMLAIIGYQSSSTGGAVQNQHCAGKYLYDGESLCRRYACFGGGHSDLFHPLNRTETLKMEETLNKTQWY